MEVIKVEKHNMVSLHLKKLNFDTEEVMDDLITELITSDIINASYMLGTLEIYFGNAYVKFRKVDRNDIMNTTIFKVKEYRNFEI